MKARLWEIQLADDEWENSFMEKVAMEKLAEDASIDCVRVNEHGGWNLTFNRSGVIVGTANDMARMSDEAKAWGQRFDGVVMVGYNRRPDLVGYKFDSYYPRIAEEVA
jgi:hypothetical protein